jgi:hypothetical protein
MHANFKEIEFEIHRMRTVISKQQAEIDKLTLERNASRNANAEVLELLRQVENDRQRLLGDGFQGDAISEDVDLYCGEGWECTQCPNDPGCDCIACYHTHKKNCPACKPKEGA